MFENYIVLSVDKTTEDGSLFNRRHRSIHKIDETLPVNYHISVERNTNEQQVRELIKNNKEIVEVLPSIPLRLVQPLNVTAGKPPYNVWGLQEVGADQSDFKGNGIKVAVLDTGIWRQHPCFQDERLTIQEEDFTGEGNGDTEGHGTHCAGIIFGRDTDGIRIGVAPGITEVLIGKVIGQRGGDSAGIVNAINWALKEHVNVISMSLGIDFPGLVKSLTGRGMQLEPATSIALEAYRKNIHLFERLASTARSQSRSALIIAAAGNESRYPDYEIATSPPAISEGILSVGALGINESKLYVAPFSNSGPAVSAPGVDILSARLGGGLVSMSGTSMATPYVAGIAALWAEHLKLRKQFSTDNLEAKICGHANWDKLSHEDPDRFGIGIVQAPRT